MPKPFTEWRRCKWLLQIEYVTELPDHDEPVGGEISCECEDDSYDSNFCDMEDCQNSNKELLEQPRKVKTVSS